MARSHLQSVFSPIFDAKLSNTELRFWAFHGHCVCSAIFSTHVTNQRVTIWLFVCTSHNPPITKRFQVLPIKSTHQYRFVRQIIKVYRLLVVSCMARLWEICQQRFCTIKPYYKKQKDGNIFSIQSFSQVILSLGVFLGRLSPWTLDNLTMTQCCRNSIYSSQSVSLNGQTLVGPERLWNVQIKMFTSRNHIFVDFVSLTLTFYAPFKPQRSWRRRNRELACRLNSMLAKQVDWFPDLNLRCHSIQTGF